MIHEPTHLDLFSGIGGFALAAQWAGFRTIGFSEVDPHCCGVLERRFPGVPNFGDIRTADFGAAGPIDLLTGGFPCQPWSVAGEHRGKEDPRHLWPAMRDVIAATRPAWVIGENVAGIISLGLDEVLSDLEAINYTTQPITIPACAVGADHERERVWVIAYTESIGRREKLGRTSGKGRYAALRTTGSAVNPDSQGLQAPGEYRAPANTPEGFDVLPASSGFPGRETYPDLLREVHGIPRRMDRIKGLGNAIVPQVAYEILRYIRAMI